MQTVPPLLHLCARTDTHPDLTGLLTTACSKVTDWERLLQLAEEHGMAPLLARHLAPLQELVPADFIRGLRFLSLRHKQANAAIVQALYQLLSLLKDEGIPSLVLKGAALCQTVYPEVGLRPMRDIDILLTPEDAQHCHTLLQQHGFRVSTAAMPEAYYHLPPLYLQINGIEVCLELHHELFPKEPPYYTQLPFATLYNNARPFSVHTLTAKTLAHEEMLWHLYQHGFHAPLTYEPYRLISAADIISLIGTRKNEIDWQKIRYRHQLLYKALPLFHHLTPWNNDVFDIIKNKKNKTPSGVGKPYQGWPRIQFTSKDRKKNLQIFLNTIAPSHWWLMLYYGADNHFLLLWCLLIRHPVHLGRWIKIRWNIFTTKKKVRSHC